MIKKAVILALTLILVQTAIAAEENYNRYSSLEMNVKVSSTLNVEKKSPSGSVELLTADLELFPRTTSEQEVTRQDVNAEPTASVKKGDKTIEINWYEPNTDKITYTVDSDVTTYNRIRKIIGKVDFPIENIEPDLKSYTQSTEYIDINMQIREQAANIAEGETDLYVVTSKVGEWVRKNIKYDLNSLTANVVQKSSWVITNKEGVCDELTNLFISMMRSLGVPARFVSGVVYSNVGYDFENHGWAEVYMPDYGWVPFDITFGQYGWVDPSHVKMQESVDSGEAAVTYDSRTRSAELKSISPEVSTKIIRKDGQVTNLIKLEANPLEQEVGFGSFMILEVNAENTQNYYMPLNIVIKKAPQLVEKDSTIHTALKPKEKKKFYWIMKIPDNLNTDFIYESDIEVEGDFAENATSEIKYGQGFKKYTQEWAQETLDKLIERENKILFTNIQLDCITDKEHYTSSENAKITCDLRNIGNKNLNNVSVCLIDKCKEIALSIAEQKNVQFEVELKKSENITISAETEKYIKEQTIKLDVEEIPDVKITGYEPEILGYAESATLKLKIFTRTKAKNIKLIIRNVGEVTIPELEGGYTVEVPVKGKQFRRGLTEIKINYKDEKGNEYMNEEKIGITITGLTWYGKTLNLFGL